MKNLALLVTLLLVAAISYGLGRRHGASTRALIPAAPTNIDTTSAAASGIPKTETPREAQPVIEQSEKSDSALPFAQNSSSFEKGYEAAIASVDEALSQIQTLRISERKGFVTGIFSFVARNRSPS